MSLNKKPRIMRQGDVLLIAITSCLLNAKVAARENGRVVLAHGEVTGHSHAIAEPDANLMVMDDREQMAEAVRELLRSVGLTMEVRDEEVVGVLHTPTGAALVHEEHDTITLSQANHVVLRQREYSPEEIQQVAD